LYICTIEKALNVVQSLIEADRLDEVGMVVVDELHLLSEGSGRGAALESMLTYVMHCSGIMESSTGMSNLQNQVNHNY